MELDLKAEDDIILADLSQIQQIVVNLGTNALHAMEKKGGVLTIGLANVALPGADPLPGVSLPPGKYACLSVRDTGAGMSDDVRRRIFEPFFTTKAQGKGRYAACRRLRHSEGPRRGDHRGKHAGRSAPCSTSTCPGGATRRQPPSRKTKARLRAARSASF